MRSGLLSVVLLLLLTRLIETKPAKKDFEIARPNFPWIRYFIPEREDLRCKYSTVYDSFCFSRISLSFSNISQPYFSYSHLPYIFYYNEYPERLEPEQLNLEVLKKIQELKMYSSIKNSVQEFKNDMVETKEAGGKTLPSSIPKILNFIWIHSSEEFSRMPENQMKNIEEYCKMLDQEWKIRLWLSDIKAAKLLGKLNERLDVKSLSEVKMVQSTKNLLNEYIWNGFEKYPEILYGLYITYAEGGVYNSLDVRLRLPFSYLLQNNSAILLSEDHSYSLDFFAVPEKCSVLLELIGKVKKAAVIEEKYPFIKDAGLNEGQVLKAMWTAAWVREFVSKRQDSIQNIMVLTESVNDLVKRPEKNADDALYNYREDFSYQPPDLFRIILDSERRN